jgi:diguanylate cyclase (GGDEF)-like protein
MQSKIYLKQFEWPQWWRLAIVAVMVGVMAWGSIVLTREGGRVASIWLANGALLGVLLTTRWQRWPAYLLAGYLANFTADWLAGDRAAVAVLLSACNTFEILIAATPLHWYLTDASDLTRRRTFSYFIFYGVLLAPALTALIAAVILKLVAGNEVWPAFSTWYLADALGIALVTPLVLSVRQSELATLFGRTAITKTLSILILTALVTTAVFVQTTYPLLFVLFPVLMWAIFELGFTGTAITIFIAAIIAIVSTIEGRGPMMMIEGLTDAERILFLQITIVTAVMVALPIALILAERERLRAALEKANSVLHSLAMTDGLTGLANRRCFDEMLEREWRRTGRESDALSLLMVDIDHFKMYNDYYGHQSGDECLKAVAQTLMKTSRRSGDFCARYGGEEFSIILPNTDAAKAARIGKAVCAAIEALSIEHVKTASGWLTVSVGIASIKPRDSGTDIRSLIESADRALYRAKNEGRNRVTTV